MKYLFIIAAFIISSVAPVHVHAGAGGGGSTEITQKFNNLELIGVNISDAATAVSTGQDMVKNVILDPIANALISSALEGTSNDIMSWVSGGFGGADPLIVTDPEGYLKKQGLGSVKGLLGNIPSDTPFGDSIFNTLLSQYKGSDDVKSQIAQLSKSKIPGLVQNNLCVDKKITSLALGAIQNTDGTYDEQELANKKTELWNYACTGSPDDPVTAARLTDLSNQNFEVGGWSAWLALTSGESEYEKARKATDLAAKSIEEQKQLNIKELYDGLGALSEKECADPVEATEPGEQAGCNEWITTMPGDAVNEVFGESLTAGTKRLENIMGSGSLTGMLQGFAISAITSGFKKALNSSGNGSNYNLTVTLPSSRPVVQDLVNDPLKKTENLNPMEKQMKYYQDALTSLAAFDSRYMADLVAYENRVKIIKDCSTASAIYNNRMGLITPTKASIADEQANTTRALAYIADTRARLQASDSSTEQRTIFTAYMAAIDDRGYPAMQAEGFRKNQHRDDKRNADNDTELSNAITSCSVVPVAPGNNNESPGNN